MIINPDIDKYIEQNATAEDPVLKELERETNMKVLNPRMLSGHIQGKFLEIISNIIGPKYILEVGTYTGYSGICLAKGLQDGGILYTIECNDEILRYPKKYFEKAGISSKTKIYLGDAMEIIPTIDKTFDLVFIDADKSQYLDYYKMCIDKLNSGGVILTDNVLWSAKVTGPLEKNDIDTAAILEFNKFVALDGRVDVVILPLRDGISLIRKK